MTGMKGTRGTWESDAEEEHRFVLPCKETWVPEGISVKETKPNLEGQWRSALGLPADDEDEQNTHHEDDWESHHVPNCNACLNRQYAEG